MRRRRSQKIFVLPPSLHLIIVHDQTSYGPKEMQREMLSPWDFSQDFFNSERVNQNLEGDFPQAAN